MSTGDLPSAHPHWAFPRTSRRASHQAVLQWTAASLSMHACNIRDVLHSAPCLTAGLHLSSPRRTAAASTTRVLRISAELGPPCNTNPSGSLIPTPPPPVPRRSKTLNQQVRITTLHCVRGIHLTCRTPLRRSTCACMPLLNYFDGAPLLEQFVIVECYECRPPCHTTPKHVRPCDS